MGIHLAEAKGLLNCLPKGGLINHRPLTTVVLFEMLVAYRRMSPSELPMDDSQTMGSSPRLARPVSIVEAIERTRRVHAVAASEREAR